MTPLIPDTSKPRTKAAPTIAMRPDTLTIDAFCAADGIGRTNAYELIAAGKIKTVKIAGRRLVPTTEADRLLAEALAEAA